MSDVIHTILNILNYGGLFVFGIYVFIYVTLNSGVIGINVFNLIDTLFLIISLLTIYSNYPGTQSLCNVG